MIENPQTHAAELERQELIKSCHSLIAKIGYKASCIKLLKLAQTHLLMLSNYKANRR